MLVEGAEPKRAGGFAEDPEGGGYGSRRLENALPLQGTLPADSVTPRAALVAALLEGAARCAVAGDLEAARVAHEAAGRLLGVAGERAAVVDLGEVRARHSG